MANTNILLTALDCNFNRNACSWRNVYRRAGLDNFNWKLGWKAKGMQRGSGTDDDHGGGGEKLNTLAKRFLQAPFVLELWWLLLITVLHILEIGQYFEILFNMHALLKNVSTKDLNLHKKHGPQKSKVRRIEKISQNFQKTKWHKLKRLQ